MLQVDLVSFSFLLFALHSPVKLSKCEDISICQTLYHNSEHTSHISAYINYILKKLYSHIMYSVYKLHKHTHAHKSAKLCPKCQYLSCHHCISALPQRFPRESLFTPPCDITEMVDVFLFEDALQNLIRVYARRRAWSQLHQLYPQLP